MGIVSRLRLSRALLTSVAVTGLVSYGAPVCGQVLPDAENEAPLDPDSPLTEFPDFGVDWPDLDAAPAILEEEQEDDTALENRSAAEELEAAIAQDSLDGESQAAGATAGEPVRTAQDELFNTDTAEVFQPDNAMEETRYRVEFSGLPENVENFPGPRFESLSALQQYRKDDANFAQIKRRAETDRELIERLLRIEGYYDAVVRSRFSASPQNSLADELVVVTFDIIAGPQYRLDDIVLNGLEQAQAEDPQRFQQIFGLQSGDIINSDAIIAAQARLDEALAENGYAFAKSEEPELVIDHAERAGDLTVPVTPGGKYVFGAITMPNIELFGPDHVKLIARFDKGDIYKASDVEDLRRALIATGLISTVTLEPVVADESGSVDLAVNLTPAPLRTIAGELGYGTGEGLRSEISWEHRNLFPPEGLIRMAAVLGTQEQTGSIAFRRNNYRRRDNVLNGRVALSNIDQSAYEARTFSVSANIERLSNIIYQKRWSWSAGIELIASQEREFSGDNLTSSRETYFIGALPASVTYDTSDSLLDPKKGFRLSALLAPEASLQDGSFFYLRNQFDGSAYFPVSEKIVMAGRARFASLLGAGSNRIAPSRRLYAGGGGSVRGYGYQRIGPRDVNNDPAGGNSLVEFSLEARIRLDAFGGNFGIVPFVDAGNVYSESLPDFSGMRFGAGIGVRYYSDFGPIRIDVGTPINPQQGDSPVAVYVSLGQAF